MPWYWFVVFSILVILAATGALICSVRLQSRSAGGPVSQHCDRKKSGRARKVRPWVAGIVLAEFFGTRRPENITPERCEKINGFEHRQAIIDILTENECPGALFLSHRLECSQDLPPAITPDDPDFEAIAMAIEDICHTCQQTLPSAV